ncbi:MAG: DtxR family transcriptional regulator [Clostridiaceae bacterium]|nr:DtxR family transcriptional regulator [Clostridiaceae bacterium]
MNNDQFHTVRGYQLMEQSKRLLTPAMEDYLEMIYRYSLQEGYIRINKLAEQLNVKASSASRMAQRLGELSMLKYEKYGIITLTEKGKQIGKFLLTRHTIIENFLRTIGSGDNLYETELIEHNISLETLRNINLLNRFLEENPEIMDKFNEYRAIHSGNVDSFP